MLFEDTPLKPHLSHLRALLLTLLSSLWLSHHISLVHLDVHINAPKRTGGWQLVQRVVRFRGTLLIA